MVIVQITGGLGNQLFMYAAGRRLALHHGTTLKLDISSFRTYGERRYLLDRFHIAQDLASPDDLAPYQSVAPESVVTKQAYYDWNPRPFIRQSQSGGRRVFRAGDVHSGTYLPEILETPPDVYLDGFWQSERYFKPVEDVIRADLRLKSELAGENLAMSQQIASVNAVSLHIRRGDYAANPHLNAVLGTLPLDYYHRAVDRMAASVSAPHFFVFSDDPEWAKANLRIGFPVQFVRHNGLATPHEDLRLMSLCRHHVTANSSLSWWGAWLCDHRGKTIIAPARWFLRLPMPDITPESWIRI